MNENILTILDILGGHINKMKKDQDTLVVAIREYDAKVQTLNAEIQELKKSKTNKKEG